MGMHINNKHTLFSQKSKDKSNEVTHGFLNIIIRKENKMAIVDGISFRIAANNVIPLLS